MVVKTFRGLLADGGQDRIRLSTIKGKVGYRITKFQMMPEKPYVFVTATIMIWKKEQTTVPTSTALINFSDSDLLAAGNWIFSSGEGSIQDVTIFDMETVNQDIYITYTEETSSTLRCNYYLELEVIPLDDAGAEYTTLKDMRSV